MTMRQWSVVAILFFLNAFIFTILFLLLRQVYLTPPEVAVRTPTPARMPFSFRLPDHRPFRADPQKREKRGLRHRLCPCLFLPSSPHHLPTFHEPTSI